MIKKKLFTILLAAVLLLSVVITAQAAGAYTVSLAGADGNNVISAKPGDTVTLLLSAANNPGITSIGVNISYPKELSVVSHEIPADAASKMKSDGKFTPNIITTSGSSFVFYMNQATGTTEKKLVTYNGTLYQLTFKVADDATSGDYNINLAARSGANLTSKVDGSGNIIPTSVEYVDNITMTGCTIQVKAGCENHSYGAWKDAGDGKHSRACSVCGTVETVDHTWDSGAVTKQPSCNETGTMTYTCTAGDCGATKTEVIDKNDNHSFSAWKDAENGKHSHTCAVCQMVETEDHVWNEGEVIKASTCNEEGVRSFTCMQCKAKKEEPIAKDNNHTYDNTCDPDCNVCGQTHEITHRYGESWRTNKNEHWYQCTICGNKGDVALHTPGPEPTLNKAQICTVCDYELAPALEATEPSEETEETTQPATEETTAETTQEVTVGSEDTTTVPSVNYNDPEKPKNQGLLVTLLLVIIVACAGVLILLLKKKK